jgi:hypothetical protein
VGDKRNKHVKGCCNFRRKEKVVEKEAENSSDITENVECKKTKVIPVIKGASVTFRKSFRKYGNDVIGKHDIVELYKTVILGVRHPQHTQTSSSSSTITADSSNGVTNTRCCR